MTVLLPRAPAQYDQSDQQQLRGALERDAATNLKDGGPYDLKSPNGKIWRPSIDNAGTVTWTALP